MSFYNIDMWHKNLKKSFRKQTLIFYLGFGEPTLGKMFPKIVKMVEREKNWELRVISNLSTHQLKKAASTKLAEEGRLHIVGSFHPTMTSKEKYLQELEFYRSKGIEIPTVYVAHPEFLSHFEDDIKFFSKNNYLVHVRRLQGIYKNKRYPYSYSEKERKIFEKYMDDGMLKYMQSGISHHNALTYAGVHFFVMDNKGNIGYDANYTKKCFGNIHDETFKPLLLPGTYPGYSEGTDDGIANIIKYDYKELENNHVVSFAKQGGVYKNSKGKIIYGNKFTDFEDPKIRAEYNLPARGIKDLIAKGATGIPKVRDEIKNKLINCGIILINNNPRIKRLLQKFLNRK